MLSYHVVNGANVLSSTLSNGQNVTSFQGTDFRINIVDANASITDDNGGVANIIAVDVQGSNGVVHAIDAVILP